MVRKAVLSEEDIRSLSTEDLLKMVNMEYDRHHEVHLVCARDELSKRGLSLLFTRVAPRKRRLLFIEAWVEDREFQKELLKHIYRYALLFIPLALAKVLLNRLGYPADRAEPLEVIHYYGTLIVLLIFTISFIFKVFAFEFRGKSYESDE